MINLLAGLMAEATYSESIDQALPVLKELALIDADFTPNEDDDYSENVHDIVNALQESNSESIFTFDSECIENRSDYADLTKQLFAALGVADAIIKIKSDYSINQEKAGLALRIGETDYKKTWSQTSDYVSEEYFSFIDDVVTKEFDQRLLSLPTQDQCCRLVLVNPEHYAPLNELLTLAQNGIDADTYYQYRFWITVAITVVGFVITPFIGWYFFGFWKSALFSLVFWLIFGAINLYRVATRVVEEEKIEKLQKEDPALFAQSIMTAFVEEAAKKEKDSPMGKRLKAVAEVRKKELEEKLASKITDPA